MLQQHPDINRRNLGRQRLRCMKSEHERKAMEDRVHPLM